MTDLTGQYLGRYYLTERLGEGGMAVVYKAYDTRLERDVAVKIIRSGVFPPDDLEQVLKRFEREAKALAKLSHPNIVKVYDYGEHDGSPYLIMEYLPGGTLKKLLGKPVPWQDAVRLILPVARGVAYAHQRGILHRDIKPANVLITDGDEPMLSDFGIAKLFEGDQATALTGSGMAIGTPEYMAPEQWTGVTSPQSDQYSLGIVLYEMVAGRKPYVADTPGAILIKQVTEPLPGPRKFVAELPETVEHVLIKALAREPGDRYENVNSFIAAIENLYVAVPVVTVPEPKPVEDVHQIPEPKRDEPAPTEIVTKAISQPVVDVTNEPQKLEEPRPAKIKVAKPKRPIKFSRRSVGILIGGIVVILAVWFGSPLVEKLYAPVPAVTEQATGTLTVTIPPVVESQTLEPTQASETPTLEIIPTETSGPIPTPLPTEISDAKGAQMVLVPAGLFTMGTYEGGPEGQPPHLVYLSDYYIDKYEVTNTLYKECVDAGVCDLPANTTKYNISQYAQHPVAWVYWSMAKTYCEWRGARLPTEAEWEKAARGTDERTFPWGEGINSTYANYNNNVGETTVVGNYPKGVSPYGAYDMAGNVEEWVADWYGENYYRLSPKSNPTGPESGDYRLLRGGAWDDGGVQSTWRNFYLPMWPKNYYPGFRCALPVDSTASQSATTQTPQPEPVVNVLPTEITDEKDVTMRLVSAGKFTMGADSKVGFQECQKKVVTALGNYCNSGFFKQAEPPHKVLLDNFYIDKYEITNALYRICVDADVCEPPESDKNNGGSLYFGNPEFDNYPVIFVNWNMANTYCEWRGARLPAESEWEKAARGVDERIYPWGGGLSCDYANYWPWGTSGCVGTTTRVGKYKLGKSPYDVYDMAGNVWEWTADLFEAYPGGDAGLFSNYGDDYRVIRGGAWVSRGEIPYVMSFERYASLITETSEALGFRCAKSEP